jgi:D-alanyl-D-alanine carboxypeptidase
MKSWLSRAVVALVAVALGAVAAPSASATQVPVEELTAAGVPGAVVITADGERLAAGYADLARHRRMDAGDRFRVGSVTKTFVSTVVLQLAGERRLSLDDPIGRWVRGAGKVPLRRLLDHTSGIYNHAEDPRIIGADPYRQWRPRELVAISASHPPYFEPGAGFHYSNTNYVLLGLAIEKVTGRPLAAALERRLLRPLGLRDTSYTEGRIHGRHAHGYADGVDVTDHNTSWAGASGALVSTAGDLARFYRALLSGRVLAPHLLAAMKTRDPVAGPYGLGLFSVPTSCGEAWGHNGALAGYNANAYASEDGKRQVVVLVNRYPLDQRAQAAVDRVLDAAYCG